MASDVSMSADTFSYKCILSVLSHHQTKAVREGIHTYCAHKCTLREAGRLSTPTTILTEMGCRANRGVLRDRCRMCIVHCEWPQARLSGDLGDENAEVAGQKVAQGGKAHRSTTGTGVLVVIGWGLGAR